MSVPFYCLSARLTRNAPRSKVIHRVHLAKVVPQLLVLVPSENQIVTKCLGNHFVQQNGILGQCVGKTFSARSCANWENTFSHILSRPKLFQFLLKCVSLTFPGTSVQANCRRVLAKKSTTWVSRISRIIARSLTIDICNAYGGNPFGSKEVSNCS